MITEDRTVFLGTSSRPCWIFSGLRLLYAGLVTKLAPRPYAIASTTVRIDRDVDVVVAGPGMSPGGSKYVLSTIERGRILVGALNLAYENGFSAGLDHARHQTGPAAVE